MGKGDLPDLLWISYSATDLVGHAYGPDSHELLDAYARADREVARLLAKLDAAAGEGNYVFAITADHGVTEIPDHAKKNGRDGGRVTFTVDRQGIPPATPPGSRTPSPRSWESARPPASAGRDS